MSGSILPLLQPCCYWFHLSFHVFRLTGLTGYNQQQQELISGCFSLLLCENSLYFLL